MDTHHRKVDLQSAADLLYLLNNIKTAAQQKLDLAIPPSAAPKGEDTYRSKVEELVQEYILKTLSLALPSLTLNGLDSPSTLLNHSPAPIANTPDETSNYEPYDPRLAEKLRSLYADFDAQSTRVAELRREAPGATARQHIERLSEELRIEKEAEAERAAKDNVADATGTDMGFLERGEHVEMTWKRGTQHLIELGKIPRVKAKFERAGKAAEVVDDI